MVDWTSSGDVMGELNRIIESKREVEKARGRLEEYKRTVGEPQASQRFDDVSELLSYIERKNDYERGLNAAEDTLEEAEEAYKQTAAKVQEFLPAGSEIRYDYQGKRKRFRNKKYVIHNQRDEVTVRELPHETPKP